MGSEATPRINAHYLDSFANQTVRILGKVTSLHGETATVDANGSITVHLNRVRIFGPLPRRRSSLVIHMVAYSSLSACDRIPT